MRRIVLLVLLTTAIAIIAPNAQAANRVASGNPEQAWRDYIERSAHVGPRYRFPHANCFKTAAVAHGLPETLLLAVARGESDFDATARSKANAHGVMQILWPGTANHLGIYRLTELYDPCTNIDAGARYLKEMLARFDGDLHLALAAYNYGPERIAADKNNIPTGARWYSDYIYRHLRYVLADESSAKPGEKFYSTLGRTPLLDFSEPYRAAAFVERLEQRAPDLQLDWFRAGIGQFSVMLLYEDKTQFDRSAQLLADAGFPLD